MITSLSNAQLKHVLMLQKKGKYRSECGQFVAEGLRMVLETPRELLDRVYVSQSFASGKDGQAWLREHRHEVVEDKVFKGISQTQTPQGILAVVKMQKSKVSQLMGGESLLVLENLQDPGNLGTILRTAEGAGMDGVLMDRTCVDIYNPKVVRSTMGSLYRVPFAYVDDLHDLLKTMRAAGTALFAAHLKGTKTYYEADFSGRCAFLIGNEANGLTDATAALATEYVKIPMSGQLESLNAAMAAGVLMYELRRQKNIRK